MKYKIFLLERHFKQRNETMEMKTPIRALFMILIRIRIQLSSWSGFLYVSLLQSWLML